MRILERVEIFNFQSHKHSVINISPVGLTVITGASHHGKSAVARAVGWVLYNRPQGNDFFRHGTKECRVILSYADGVSVERRKTVSLNQYWIRFDDQKKDDQLFEGFGYDVPLEVQKVTGCYNYKINDKKTLNLNIAEQGEGLFLGKKDATDTERAQILGKLAGTEDVDRANSKLKTDIYHAKQDKKQLEADIKEKDKEIKDYAWVKPLGKKLEKLEKIQDKVGRDTDMLELLRQKKQQLEQINNEINLLQQELEQFEVLPEVFELIKSNEPDIKFLVDVIKWNKQLNEIDTQITAEKLTIQDCGQPEQALNVINIKQNETHKLMTLFRIQNQLEDVRVKTWGNEQKIKEFGQPQKALQILQNCSNNITSLSTLIKHDNNYTTYDNKISDIKDKLSQYQEIGKAKTILINVEKDIFNLDILREKERVYKDNTQKKDAFIYEVDDVKESLQKSIDELDQAKKEYKELYQEAGICPYCGSEVDEECLEHVI